jgi:phosphoribosylanthranilate isomerase
MKCNQNNESVQVKVCGLTRKEDLDYVNIVKPDYIGFVFAKSRRQIDIDLGKVLIKNLDKGIKTVGVFVNENIDIAKNIAKTLNLDVMQFHGDEDLSYIKQFKDYEVWKAINVATKEDLESIKTYRDMVEGILLDSKVDGRLNGGNGVAFDWGIIDDLKLNNKLILAGGLNINNVERAINIVKPNIIDVSSGVEKNGIKDFEMIKAFIDEIRGIKK